MIRDRVEQKDPGEAGTQHDPPIHAEKWGAPVVPGQTGLASEIANEQAGA